MYVGVYVLSVCFCDVNHVSKSPFAVMAVTRKQLQQCIVGVVFPTLAHLRQKGQVVGAASLRSNNSNKIQSTAESTQAVETLDEAGLFWNRVKKIPACNRANICC